jgi:HK97 family phage major capsid protein
MRQDCVYSILSIKSVDDQRRVFTGTATTPTPDRGGDIVEPLGVSFKNPLPLLLHHDMERPVGTVKFHPPTKDGIDFTAEIPIVDGPPSLKERLDETWASIKARLLTGVSIRVSAKADDVKILKGGAIHWLKSVVTELSLVTIPQNAEATIAVVKSLDVGRPAATGIGPDSTHTPGASGTSRVVRLHPQRDAMKTITEQLTSYKATRDAKHAEMTAMATKSAEDGTTFDADQETSYDTLKGEVDALNKHIGRLEDLEKANVATAAAVKGTNSKDGSESRGRIHQVSVKPILEPSLGFARVAMCIAASKGIGGEAIRIAESHFGAGTDIVEAVKTAVGAATTSNNQGPAVQYADYAQGFIDYLRAKTILDKFGSNGIPALSRVPFNVRVSTQTAGATAGWVGEGKPKPVSKGTFGTTTLDFSKIAVICALTKEEVRFGVSGAEQKIRNDMARAIAAGIDSAFIDPANAGTANVKPAAITYNVAASAVTGTTPAAAQLDIANMLQTMITAGIQGNSLVLIMTQGIAMKLGLARNSLGNRINPELNMRGGFFEGYPVIVSEAVATLGSPTANMVVAVNAEDIFLADDGNVAIDASEQASLQMDDAPGTQDGTTGTGTSLVSLWQTNMLGLRAEREIAWKVTRSAAVQYLSGVNYSVA